jgi:Vitamin K-dependent gamma-carboxylase
VGVGSVFLVSALTASYRAVGYLPVELMHPPGVMEYLSWKFYERLVTPNAMLTLQVLTVLALSMSVLGIATAWATKVSALLVLLFEGVLGSFGHTFAARTVGLYFLFVLAVSPCGDALSLDSRRGRRSIRPAWVYTYPILLMQGLLAWSYFGAGINKLRVAGLQHLSPDNLPVLAIRHSLDNAHPTQFTLALRLPELRSVTPLMAGAGLLWELSFPLALLWRRALPVFLVVGIAFHLATMLLMNIMFWNQIAMYLIFIDWPTLVNSLVGNVTGLREPARR